MNTLSNSFFQNVLENFLKFRFKCRIMETDCKIGRRRFERRNIKDSLSISYSTFFIIFSSLILSSMSLKSTLLFQFNYRIDGTNILIKYYSFSIENL